MGIDILVFKTRSNCKGMISNIWNSYFRYFVLAAAHSTVFSGKFSDSFREKYYSCCKCIINFIGRITKGYELSLYHEGQPLLLQIVCSQDTKRYHWAILKDCLYDVY